MYLIIIIPLLVALVTQVIKLTIDGIPNNLNWQYLFSDYGGMPSSHASLVTSLALITGLQTGFGEAPFAISFILAIIVIRDAVGFRREIGKNAELTNVLAEELFPTNPEIQIRERVGHTPKEVVIGIIFGLVLTLIFYWLTIVL